MSQLNTPPSTPPPTVHFDLPTQPSLPISNAASRPQLPEPPSAGKTPQQMSKITRLFAEYYWPRHFEVASVDPAMFIDRIMTDYTNYETDVVGEWLENMSPPYKLYKACLQYGVSNGTPAKAMEARQYQRVIPLLNLNNWKRTLPREPGVQDARNRHRQLRTQRAFQNSTPAFVMPRQASALPPPENSPGVSGVGLPERPISRSNTTLIPGGPQTEINEGEPSVEPPKPTSDTQTLKSNEKVRKRKSNRGLKNAAALEEELKEFVELLKKYYATLPNSLTPEATEELVFRS